MCVCVSVCTHNSAICLGLMRATNLLAVACVGVALHERERERERAYINQCVCACVYTLLSPMCNALANYSYVAFYSPAANCHLPVAFCSTSLHTHTRAHRADAHALTHWQKICMPVCLCVCVCVRAVAIVGIVCTNRKRIPSASLLLIRFARLGSAAAKPPSCAKESRSGSHAKYSVYTLKLIMCTFTAGTQHLLTPNLRSTLEQRNPL